MKKIAVIPGDGIGVEVTREAVRVLERVSDLYHLDLQLIQFDWGAEKYLKEGISLPDGALGMLSDQYDAILTGAFGDPRVPGNQHAADILLGIRFGLDLYINLRPVRLLHDSFTPLKGRSRADIDFVVFRENTEGMYMNAGGILRKGMADEVAIQEEISTRKGVERIIRAAFEYARAHKRESVAMADKANVLTFGHELWRRVFKSVADEFPDVPARAEYVDAMAMFLVTDPGRYDVIVTNNLFGDILTDLGAGLQGGLGVAASANLHPGRTSLFEPVHGSAPDKAGQGVANPIGAILSSAMMLENLGFSDASAAIERAVEAACQAGEVTPDLGGSLTTERAALAIGGRIQ